MSVNDAQPPLAADALRRLAELEMQVQELQDRDEIRRVMYAYARGTDRCQPDMIESAYHDDAWDDHGSFSGDRDEAVRYIASNPSRAATAMHHLGNILIELCGDAANVETYFVAWQRHSTSGRTYTRVRAGRYLDRFERRGHVWRIAQRTVVDDFNRIDEIVEADPSVGSQCRFGTRGPDDPSYELSDFANAWTVHG